jgi:ATP-dependent Clp protease ATP-binding subunit ClpA
MSGRAKASGDSDPAYQPTLIRRQGALTISSELAATEAGDGPVRPEHMLVSLATVEDCIAARILDHHGVTLTALREALT